MPFKSVHMSFIQNKYMREINVSLVYAITEQQWLFETKVARGTTAAELFQMAKSAPGYELLRQLDLDLLSLGVFAQKIDEDYLLEEGDRVEIYRPLKADPKEVRRQLASLGKTIGKNKS